MRRFRLLTAVAFLPIHSIAAVDMSSDGANSIRNPRNDPGALIQAKGKTPNVWRRSPAWSPTRAYLGDRRRGTIGHGDISLFAFYSGGYPPAGFQERSRFHARYRGFVNASWQGAPSRRSKSRKVAFAPSGRRTSSLALRYAFIGSSALFGFRSTALEGASAHSENVFLNRGALPSFVAAGQSDLMEANPQGYAFASPESVNPLIASGASMAVVGGLSPFSIKMAPPPALAIEKWLASGTSAVMCRCIDVDKKFAIPGVPATLQVDLTSAIDLATSSTRLTSERISLSVPL